MPKRVVFLVEGDLETSREVRHHLESVDFGVRAFSDHRLVIAEAKHLAPKLFIIDAMAPSGDALALCRAIRAEQSLLRVPIILLVSAVEDRIRALEMGADDCVSNPFSPRELVARAKAVQRRYSPHRSFPIRVGELELDARAMTLTVRGEQFPTSITEVRLLDHFFRNVGRVFTREQIVSLVWGEDNLVTTHAVDVCIQRVREKIEEDPGNPVYLKTVRGVGFRFDSFDSLDR